MNGWTDRGRTEQTISVTVLKEIKTLPSHKAILFLMIQYMSIYGWPKVQYLEEKEDEKKVQKKLCCYISLTCLYNYIEIYIAYTFFLYIPPIIISYIEQL
jgi:hypothetical protein